MTVRDEAAGLERCLASLAGLVDEMLVYDTGSEDESPRIAERMGARVIHRRWDGPFDFGVARNFVCAQAAGDIAIFIDGDEWLAEESRACFRREIEGLRPGHAMTLAVHSFTDPDRLIPELTVVSHMARVHWLSPRFRWVRPVHTQIIDSQTGGTPPFQRSGVKLFHTGYLAEAWSEKRKAGRLAQLEQLAAEEPSQAHSHQFVAQLHLVERRFDQAAQWARRALEAGLADPGNHAVLIAQNILLEALLQSGRLEEFRREAAAGVARFPGSGEARFNAAIASFLGGKLDEAERGLRALAQTPGDTLDQSILSWKIDHYLGRIALVRGDARRAATHLSKGLELAPREPEVLGHLAEALALSGEPGPARSLAARLREIAPDSGQVEYVEALCLLAEGRDGEAAEALRNLAARGVRRRSSLLYLGCAYQVMGKAAEAAEAFREILREWPEDDGVRLALMGTLIGVGQGEEARSVARGIRPGTSAWATAAEMLVRAGLPRV